VETPILTSIDQYENAWWVRLGRILRLNRFEVFEVDATPQKCVEHIECLEQNPLKDITKTEIAIDTLKRPYRFFYMPIKTFKGRGSIDGRNRLAYIKGQLIGKGAKTIVEIEGLPTDDGIGPSIVCLLFFGPISLFFAFVIFNPYRTTTIHLDGWAAFILMLFMSTISLIMMILERNKSLKLLQTYLASLHTTTPVQSDEEQQSVAEDAPRQDSAQG
jgi:hypothetical protein